MSYDTAAPFIASYVLVEKNGKFAFVLRENTAWMNDHYGLPSGKVEKNESFTSAAIREAKEEIGIDVKAEDLKPILVVHRYEPSKQASDWVDIYFVANKWEGEPINNEPEIHSELAWFGIDELPENIIPSVKHALEAFQAGKSYIEYGWED